MESAREKQQEKHTSGMDWVTYLFKAECPPGKEGGVPGWESERGPAEPNAGAASVFGAQELLNICSPSALSTYKNYLFDLK